jgi:hypothetical protein
MIVKRFGVCDRMTSKRALWTFKGDSKRGQLSFSKGDMVDIKQESTKMVGWAWAELGEQKGYVPLNYFTPTAQQQQKTKQTTSVSTVTSTTQQQQQPLTQPVAPPRNDITSSNNNDTNRVTTIDKDTEVLLEWVQSRLPALHVTNFQSSWRSGRALCELLNTLRPGTFDLPAQYKV